jgi:hypothetical protein
VSYAKTIEFYEAALADAKERNGDTWVVDERQWIANRLITVHHWRALEEYLARDSES